MDTSAQKARVLPRLAGPIIAPVPPPQSRVMDLCTVSSRRRECQPLLRGMPRCPLSCGARFLAGGPVRTPFESHLCASSGMLRGWSRRTTRSPTGCWRTRRCSTSPTRARTHLGLTGARPRSSEPLQRRSPSWSAQGRVRELRGIGPGIERRLRELVETGDIAELRELEDGTEPRARRARPATRAQLAPRARDREGARRPHRGRAPRCCGGREADERPRRRQDDGVEDPRPRSRSDRRRRAGYGEQRRALTQTVADALGGHIGRRPAPLL